MVVNPDSAYDVLKDLVPRQRSYGQSYQERSGFLE